jgi:hypothetical protein
MNIEVTELTGKTLENLAREFAKRCILECGKLKGFSGEEAIKELNLENVKLNRKAMNKKSVSEKKVKVKEFELFPFIESRIKKSGCQGLSYNKGLYTQCQKKVLESVIYCSKCQKEASESAMGIPICGTVNQRLECGLYEFKDTKGRKPISYLKILEKEGLGEREAVYEASKLNIEIPKEHFEVIVKEKQVKEKSQKGRPKKEKTVIEANNVDDLFSQLTNNNTE